MYFGLLLLFLSSSLLSPISEAKPGFAERLHALKSKSCRAAFELEPGSPLVVSAIHNVGGWARFETETREALGLEATLSWMEEESSGNLKGRINEARQVMSASELYLTALALVADFVKSKGYKKKRTFFHNTDPDYFLGTYVPNWIDQLSSRDHVALLPVNKKLSIRDFNELSPYPIFLLEVATKSGLVDGLSLTPYSRLGHDLNHAEIMVRVFDEALKACGGNFVCYQNWIEERAKFYQEFRGFLGTLKDETEIEILEAFWFFTFHEQNFDHVKRKMDGVMTREGVLEALHLPYGLDGGKKYENLILTMRYFKGILFSDHYSDPSKVTDKTMVSAFEKLEEFLLRP